MADSRARFRLLAVAALALCCLAASPAMAFPGAGGKDGAPQTDKFDLMDANKDGKVDMEEFKAFFPSMREDAFYAIDKNGNKYIEREEWEEFIKGHAAGMKPAGMHGSEGGGAPAMPPKGSTELPLVTPPGK